MICSAAGVSGSPLTPYIPNEESLALAIIDRQADGILGCHGSERRGPLDGFVRFESGIK